MKQNKQTYLSPVTETLVIQSEGCILFLSDGVNYALIAGGAGGDDSYDDGGTF